MAEKYCLSESTQVQNLQVDSTIRESPFEKDSPTSTDRVKMQRHDEESEDLIGAFVYDVSSPWPWAISDELMCSESFVQVHRRD